MESKQNASNYSNQLVSLIKKIHTPQNPINPIAEFQKFNFVGPCSTRNTKKPSVHNRAITSEIGKPEKGV